MRDEIVVAMEDSAVIVSEKIMAVVKSGNPLSKQHIYRLVLAALQEQDVKARKRCGDAILEAALLICMEA